MKLNIKAQFNTPFTTKININIHYNIYIPIFYALFIHYLQIDIWFKLSVVDADCRLAGAALIAPVVNYWWPGFPANLSTEAYYKQPLADQWTLRVAHHLPWLTYWWNTQKFFPASSVVTMKPEIFSSQDFEIFTKVPGPEREKCKVHIL